MTETCTLCDLPTPAPPISEQGVEGTFCCRGCLDVSKAVESVDDVDADAVRERSRQEIDRTESTVQSTDQSSDRAEAFLTIDGMHCTTCESFVALRGESHDGIASVEASYATDTARVRYDPETVDKGDLPGAVSGYGYQASFRDVGDGSERARDEETFTRLLVGAALAFFIMPWHVFFLYPSYVGIETGILSADMTTDAGLYIPMGIVALFSTGVVGFTGWPILRGAYVSLRTRRPNMDLLLSIAILSAYAYSTVALVSGSIHLYYEGRLKRQATQRLADLTEAQVSESRSTAPSRTGSPPWTNRSSPASHCPEPNGPGTTSSAVPS